MKIWKENEIGESTLRGGGSGGRGRQERLQSLGICFQQNSSCEKKADRTRKIKLEEEKKIVAEFQGCVLILNNVYLMVNILIYLFMHLFIFDQQTKACSPVFTCLSK